MWEEKCAVTETYPYRKTNHFYIKLIFMLSGTTDCDTIFGNNSIITLDEWKKLVRRDSAYKNTVGKAVEDWLISLSDKNEMKGINRRFVSFIESAFESDYDFLLMNHSDDKLNETIYIIMCQVVKNLFAEIDYITNVADDSDVYSISLIRERLKFCMNNVLANNRPSLLKLSGKARRSWLEFQNRTSLGVTVGTKECDEEIKTYFKRFIVLGSKSVEACSETSYLAYQGNLVARYEMGNKRLYEGKFDEAWRWWNNEIGINDAHNEYGAKKYSSSIISLADLLDRHEKLKEINSKSFKRLEKIESYKNFYKLHKEGNENAYRLNIMQILLEAAENENEIALNMIGKQLKAFPKLYEIGNAIGSDDFLHKVDTCRKKHIFSLAGYETLDYMGFFEDSSDLSFAFAKNNIYDAIARDKEFESATKEVKKYAVEKLFESAHLGNYYALTKVVPLLLGESLCPRFAEIKINDISGYENSTLDACVREAVDNLIISIDQASDSHYYMPHYYMAMYFSSKGKYHNQAAQYLERLGIDDNTMVMYLDDAIPQFDEENAGAKVIKEHMIAIRDKLSSR